MMYLRETLSRLLRKGGNVSSSCPACETSLPPERSFCPHCYMVLRPEGMAELHEALQGAKIREDIYILRRLHHGNEDDGTSVTRASPAEVEPVPASPPPERILTRPPAEEDRIPPDKPESRRRKQKTHSLMAYAFAAPPAAGPDDLPSLIHWFLSHDPLLPNNLEVLEEAHRILYGAHDSSTYERYLARTITDDLRTYDSPDLLQEHLILLTTVYARTLQALRMLGSHHPHLQSPADLPENEQQEMWELCLRIGLTATRLRVEGWIYQVQYGEP
ncbi:MAG: hypothetical protein ACE5MG_06190, partial [Candidatus Methylomirabilales bacterium]